MKIAKGAALYFCIATLLSGCVDLLASTVRDANAKQCSGLPDNARQNCLHRRGENSIRYEPMPKKL
jgi:hypothetical protein